VIGALIEAHHKRHGPILLIEFMNRTPEPIAIIMKRDSTLGWSAISEISMDWHYDETEGFVADSTPPET
jgi:hypothetical protein